MSLQYRYWYLFIMMGAFLCTPLSAEERVHILRRGETIYSIARIYGVSFQEILMVNGIADATRVREGQRIRIPGTEARPAASFTEHRVERGETLYGIARRYGIALGALRELNGLSDVYVLREGDRLRIPVSGITESVPAGTTPAETGPVSVSGVDVRSTVTKTLDTSIRWPVEAKEVSYMTGKLYGVVLAGERSEPVRSLTQGTVVSAGPYRGFGRVAIVQMAGGYLYVYGGCESLSVKEGDRVAPGTELGKLGIDVVSAKPQLFFLVYRSNIPIDPAKAPRA
ncbi:MAG: LysM peptidoglycan-binding domain-containing M23 family metallopeptidase [Spirochaetaceae bacterium]|jgi:murein DD-endopeptidase MepM/ murein hydrolase activator NlpD|nr:LysM peptidoglycan-binding domain-containing M23 family metallopeptidase [Spirochaetaceae bacterium]